VFDFEYLPHPHLRHREMAGPPTVAAARGELHGSGRIGRAQARIGLKITMLVGTMWAAYTFTLIALISAPAAFTSRNALVIVAWVAQTFLQLVLLPIIIVGQNVQAAAADNRAQATYDDATAILAEVKAIQSHLLTQDAHLVTQDEALNRALPKASGKVHRV
jgi:hypothetical protein